VQQALSNQHSAFSVGIARIRLELQKTEAEC